MSEQINLNLSIDQAETMLVSLILTGYIMESIGEEDKCSEIMQLILKEAHNNNYQKLIKHHAESIIVSEEIIMHAMMLLAKIKEEPKELRSEHREILQQLLKIDLNSKSN